MTPSTNPTPTDVTVVCHVRAPLLLEPVDRQIETLRACESEGAIDDLLLRSWPKEIALTDNSPYQEALESFERFEQWADERGVSVRPPFSERTTTSQVTGETRELLVTPLACLEVYAADELVGVFPHTDEDAEETYTTDEAIASLRTDELPTPLGGAGAAEREVAPESAAKADSAGEAAASDCPECGDALVNGQGLFACADCGWIGTLTESNELVEHRTDAERRSRAETPSVETR